jgi:hypothetical protein
MVGIDARRIAAQVIEHQAFRDWASRLFVKPSVRQVDAPPNVDTTVSTFILRPLPNPATSCLIDNVLDGVRGSRSRLVSEDVSPRDTFDPTVFGMGRGSDGSRTAASALTESGGDSRIAWHFRDLSWVPRLRQFALRGGFPLPQFYQIGGAE